MNLGSRLRRAAVAAALMAFGVLAAWALAEASLFFLLAHPSLVRRLPQNARNDLIELHRALDRPIIQFDPERAQFDERLFYTLKPGRFEYRSREFDTHYYVNRLGVRDDDQSIVAPDIVVLGDSYAMGWGVDQEETFPQLLERWTGRRVLNTGVSSYGTLREMRMLERVDLSRTRHIIIQYCPNDIDENLLFLRGKDQPKHVPAEFQGMVRWAHDLRRYWPGRYTWWLLHRVLVGTANAEEESPWNQPMSVQAEAFVYALQHATHTAIPERVQVVLFNVDPLPAFLDEVEALIKKRSAELPAWIRAMKIVRLERWPDSYLLDDHWTPAGHVEVAKRLLPAITTR